MATYDGSNWLQALVRLGLSESDYDKARFMLADKDASFRYSMLGGNVQCNKRVILTALSESLLH